MATRLSQTLNLIESLRCIVLSLFAWVIALIPAGRGLAFMPNKNAFDELRSWFVE